MPVVVRLGKKFVFNPINFANKRIVIIKNGRKIAIDAETGEEVPLTRLALSYL
jgi:hypothetical protein